MANKIRILFYSEDFKTDLWGKELRKSGCEIVPNSKERLRYLHNILWHGKTLLKNYFQKKRVHVFIFRYLNDNRYLRVSLEYFLRDLVTILICKLTNVRVIWLLHNIDKETCEHYPVICKMRRSIVDFASQRVLVTDPHLVDFAREYGINENKLDWTCFGSPVNTDPDERNIELRKLVEDFKNSFYKKGYKNVIAGLCVSEKAKKKTHYLYADTIVGVCREREDTCVILVMIGNYPDGEEYEQAKHRVKESPYILYIDESFPVNESLIADEIDFFYRSMTDYSVAYTLYVACALEKPVITHNWGALPVIVGRENIGSVIHGSNTEILEIIFSVAMWKPQGSRQFLEKRNWKTGAERLLHNIHKTGVQL